MKNGLFTQKREFYLNLPFLSLRLPDLHWK